MSRALLALALLVGVAQADPPDPAPTRKDPRLALKAAACSQDGPSLLIRLPSDQQGSDAAPQKAQKPARLDRGNPGACAEAVASLPDSAQLAFSPSGAPAGSPNAPVSEEEARKAFEGKTATVGELSTRLGAFAQSQGIDLDVLSGRHLFDNASDAEGTKVRKELAGALEKELAAPAAAAEIPKDYPKPKLEQQKPLDNKTLPAASSPPEEQESGPEPDLWPRIPFTNTTVPLNPLNWGGLRSPPADIPQTLNPNGTTVSPSLQPRGDTINGAPIWGPFTEKLKACRPDCQAQEYGIWRNGGSSCHSVGAAIDLHSIKCGDKLYKAIEGGANSGPFAELVGCMRSDKGGGRLFAIWHQCFKNCGHDVTSNHMDHTHLSIGCGGGRK